MPIISEDMRQHDARTSISMPAELLARAREHARAEDRPLSSIVRAALLHYLGLRKTTAS
jgi:predicted DNA-binding protein